LSFYAILRRMESKTIVLGELAGSLASFYALWLRHAGERPYPARADFDVMELREWLPWLHLVELLPDGDLRYRVFASESARRVGTELTGRRFSEFRDGMPRAAAAELEYRSSLESGRPLAFYIPEIIQEARQLGYRRLQLPLGEYPQSPNMLFVCLDYEPMPARLIALN